MSDRSIAKTHTTSAEAQGIVLDANAIFAELMTLVQKPMLGEADEERRHQLLADLQTLRVAAAEINFELKMGEVSVELVRHGQLEAERVQFRDAAGERYDICVVIDDEINF